MQKLNFSHFRQIVHVTKRQRMESDWLYALLRSVSVRCSFWLLSLFPSIRPNHVSLMMVLLVGGVLISNLYPFSVPAYLVLLTQLLLLQLASLCDRVDGEIARYQQHFTQRGIYYDRVFHFLYPFALYLAVGHYFAQLHNLSWWLTLAMLLAILSVLVGIQGKMRHHIKFKILLEGHPELIRDLYPSSSTSPILGRGWRFFHYLVFMTYTWVSGLYLFLLILSQFSLYWSSGLYLLHAFISIVWFSYYLLVTYPSHALFSKQDFQL